MVVPSAIVVSKRKFWIELDGLIEVGKSPACFLFSEINISAIVECERITRVKLYRLVVIRERTIEVALCRDEIPRSTYAPANCGLRPMALVPSSIALSYSVLIEVHYARAIVSVSVIWIELNCLAAIRDASVDLSFPAVSERPRDICLGMIRLQLDCLAGIGNGEVEIPF